MSIKKRDQVVDAYRPRFELAATRTVVKEISDIESMLRKSKVQTVVDYLRAYYAYQFADFMQGAWRPVLRDFFDALFVEIETEISFKDYAYSTDDLKSKFLDDYLERFIARYADSSVGQLFALARDADDETAAAEAIQERLDEWSEKRPGKVVANESVRSSMGLYATAAFAMGLGLKWVTRSGRCPFCALLHNKKIRSGAFMQGGDELAPKGKTPMKIRSKAGHPPIHRGCHCYLMSVKD